VGRDWHALAQAPTGPLEDAKCNVEDVEIANTQQLSALLNDLANSTYFRLFQINLEVDETLNPTLYTLNPQP